MRGWIRVEVGTLHNPCQLAVVSSSGREIDIAGADEDHLELCGYDATDAALVKLREVVWPAAWARFETEAA